MLIGLAGGVVPAIVTAIAFGWPWYAWLSVALAGVVVASMLAFRELWGDRNKIRDERDSAREAQKQAESRPRQAGVMIEGGEGNLAIGTTTYFGGTFVNRPRTLKGKQLDDCKARLEHHPTSVQVGYTSDGDAAFAGEIDELLRGSGWTTAGGVTQMVFTEFPAPPPVRGVEIRLPGEQMPVGLLALGVCLQGLDFEIHVRLDAHNGRFTLPVVLVRGQ